MATQPAPPAIEARDLSHEYASRAGIVRALDAVSLTVAEGEFVSLVGPSGCGKTTLLRAAAALLTATEGALRIFGARRGALDPCPRARHAGARAAPLAHRRGERRASP